jgi:beta-glucanase (GH16 family)
MNAHKRALVPSVTLGLLLIVLPAFGAPPEGYKLAWADEFNGNQVDASKWVYRTDSKLWSTQLPANVQVADGNLVLVLKKEEAAGKHYTGGGVISRQTFAYGYYESRFKIEAGKGWHSSFWLMRHDGEGGTGTGKAELELDILENDSIDLTSYGITTHKWPAPHVQFGHKDVRTSSLSEYHVLGCEYTRQEVRYFLDGELVQSSGISALPQGELNIWLTSIAANLGHTDMVDDSRLPGYVYYDYVRFYTKEPRP